jgi:hypothetical protein
MNRRRCLHLAGAGVAFIASSRAQAKPLHRGYGGKILYLDDKAGEFGREFFRVTVQPDGTRTLRAQCEMDDVGLLRDVVLTADRDFHPIDAFVRIAVDGKTIGSSRYAFTDHVATCDGLTDQGRIAQRIETRERIRLFTAHPVNTDAWLWGAARQTKDLAPYPWFNSSLAPNGAGGPTLVPMPEGRVQIADKETENITVKAGTFAARHIQVRYRPTSPLQNTWVYGEDCVPLRLRNDARGRTYELAELSGDPK